MSENSKIMVARNNTFVAESDLEAANHAIDHCFEKELSKLQDALSDDDASRLQMALLADCRESLLANIERVVEPVSDEAFDQFVSDEDTEDSLKSRKRHDVNKLESAHQEDRLGEFDAEELIDQQASQRAKELRKSARDEAHHIRQLRIDVIDRATSLAKRQVDILMKSRQNMPQIKDHSSVSLHKVSDEAHAKLSEIRDHVNLLCSSLQTQGREKSITDSVSSLSETVSNVRHALEVPQDISKTSQAIHERNADSGSMKEMNAPDRFIQFMGQ